MYIFNISTAEIIFISGLPINIHITKLFQQTSEHFLKISNRINLKNNKNLEIMYDGVHNKADKKYANIGNLLDNNIRLDNNICR